ncbi:MAG: MFS transporter [Clostridia bacterium]|nr:MFS transporter [Clostridia bacterium]
MSENANTATTQDVQTTAYNDRRCITRKETIGFMLYSASLEFNLNGQKELFRDSVLKVSFNKQSIYNSIGGIWDCVNDILIGQLVDKTRTRWGKFVPYMFFSGLPYAAISSVYWLLPVILSAGVLNNYDSIPKFICYMLFEVLMETVTTLQTVTKDGFVATVTPYPSDRTRLLSVTGYFNGWFQGLPSTICEFLFDFITNDIIKSSKYTSAQMIQLAYTIMGPITVFAGGMGAFWFSTIARERVPQSVENPPVLQSLKVVVSNRPVLIYIISEALASFGTGISTNNYYRWVLFWSTMETICGIPSAFVQPIGFAKVGKLKKRFSTKSVYMVSTAFAKAMYIPVFLYGTLLKGKDGKPFYTNRTAMILPTMLWEIIYALFAGPKMVCAQEMQNECMDYIEWKNGFRNEATITIAKSVLKKVPNQLNEIIKPQIKKWIGFEPERYNNKQSQEPKTQLYIFAMATIFPAIIIMVSMIPMFWYNLDKETRERMYYDLIKRRAEQAETVKTEADAEVK